MAGRPQKAFEMREQGKSTAEIGEALNATEQEVHAMLYRVRKQRERKAKEPTE